MKHKTISISIAIILLMFSYKPSNSQIKNKYEALNIAEMQLVITQRVAKDYMILGINNNKNTSDKAEEELKTSIALFEQNHNELIKYSSTNNISISQQIESVYLYWEPYLDILNSPPDICCTATLVDLSKVLIKECETVIKLLKETTNIRQTNIIDISIRQKLLSQQIALYYIGNVWGNDYEQNIKKEYNKSNDEFRKALKILSAHKDNTEVINNNIKIAKDLFGYETKGLEVNENYVAEIFYVTNELYDKMNIITRMYEELDNN